MFTAYMEFLKKPANLKDMRTIATLAGTFVILFAIPLTVFATLFLGVPNFGLKTQASVPPAQHIGLGGGGFIIDNVFSSSGRLFTTIECGGVRISDDQGNTWSEASAGIPISGGEIQTMWADPFNDETVFLGKQGSIVRTTNNGATWDVVKSLNGVPFDDFAAADANTYFAIEGARRKLYGGPNTAQIVGQARIWKSTDGGTTWPTSEQVAPPDIESQYPDLVGIYRDKTNGLLYVAVSYPAGSDGVGGVYRSTDSSGTNWTTFNDGIPVNSLLLGRWLTADPNNSKILYLTLGGDDTDNNPPSRILKRDLSSDSKQWEDITNSNLPTNSNLFDVVVNGAGKVFVTNFNHVNGRGGVYRLDGTNWTHLTIPDTVDGQPATTNMTGGWVPTVASYARLPSGAALVVDPTNDNTMYFATPLRDQLFRTTDGGGNWQQIYAIDNADGTWGNRGMSMVGAYGVAVDPTDLNKILLGYGDWANAISKDGGAKWRPIGNIKADVNKILFDPGNSNYVWHVAGFREPNPKSFGVSLSTNGGDNWSLIAGGASNLGGLPGGYTRDIALDLGTPAGAERDAYVVVEKKGVYKQVNRSSSWVRIDGDTTGLDVSSTLADPVRTIAFDHVRDIIYVGFEKSSSGATGGVYKSSNGGASWQLVAGTSGKSLYRGMAVNTTTGDLYFGAAGGLYRFNYYTQTVERLNQDAKIQGLQLVPGAQRQNDVVYFAAEDMVVGKISNIVSATNLTVTNFTSRLPAGIFAKGRGIAYDQSNDALYLSLQCGGAYKIPAVNGGTPDIEDPTVFITSPTNGQTVSGSISIQATASDNVASFQLSALGSRLLIFIPC